jgi:hypothetical protein
MTVEDVLGRAALLERALDKTVEGAATSPEMQAYADWAWYRFKSVLDFVIQHAAGTVAASLARSLLEEAAYWDWALAEGVGAEHLVRRAAVEYEGLVRLANEVGDDVWVRWLLPPGAELSAPTDAPVPHNPGDAVKRIGNGLAAPVLDSLRFRGLFAANHLLDVLTHGNMAAALVMAPGGGEELPEPLAAAVVHVAAAGATAVVTATLDVDAAAMRQLSELATSVAAAAADVHLLPRLEAPTTRRPPKVRSGARLFAASDIERMPHASPTTTASASRFVDASAKLVQTAVRGARLDDAGAAAAWAAFQTSWSQMLLLAGVAQGTVGRALLPFAARALLEDGARWGWLRQRAAANPSGDSLRAVVSDSKRHIQRVRESMVSDGVRRDAVDRLLGHADQLMAAEPGPHELPPMGELLATAYANSSGVDSARVMYSVLSQFLHASPLSMLHVRRDDLPSLTAPVYAIAVEAACRGFWSVALTTLTICCERDEALDKALTEVASALAAVRYDATAFHTLG